MKWYYVPYRSLKPYRVMGLELLVQVPQSSTHAQLGVVEYPLKATVNLDNYLGALRAREFEVTSNTKHNSLAWYCESMSFVPKRMTSLLLFLNSGLVVRPA